MALYSKRQKPKEQHGGLKVIVRINTSFYLRNYSDDIYTMVNIFYCLEREITGLTINGRL